MSGTGPTHQQTDTSFRTPRPCSQRPRNLALPTSEPALAPGLPGPQPHPPAGQHQFQDTLDPSASCPGIQPHSTVGHHQLLDTPKPWSQPCGTGPAHQQADTRYRTSSPHHHPLQSLAPPTSGPALIPGLPGAPQPAAS